MWVVHVFHAGDIFQRMLASSRRDLWIPGQILHVLWVQVLGSSRDLCGESDHQWRGLAIFFVGNNYFSFSPESTSKFPLGVRASTMVFLPISPSGFPRTCPCKEPFTNLAFCGGPGTRRSMETCTLALAATFLCPLALSGHGVGHGFSADWWCGATWEGSCESRCKSLWQAASMHFTSPRWETSRCGKWFEGWNSENGCHQSFDRAVLCRSISFWKAANVQSHARVGKI